MNSLILALSMTAVLQAPPEAEFKRLVHVVDNNSAMKVVLLPYKGEIDITYIPTSSRAPIGDEEIILEALSDCKYASKKRRGESMLQYESRRAKDESLLRQLLQIEKSYGVPASLRGMLLAAACHESGYNHKAKGDRKFSKSKRRYLAKGLFQMWPWWEKAYKIDRTDPHQSAHAYMKHITRQTTKVGKTCGKKLSRNDKRKWVVAWVTAIRAPKANGRCYEKPRFYRILNRWHRNIKKYRKQMENCAEDMDGCGC